MSLHRNAAVPLLLLVAAAVPFVAATARHRPRPPRERQAAARATRPAPKDKHPAVPQLLEGGLWRTDGSYQSVLMLKNVLEDRSIAVTPALYMADGYEYDLPPVQIDPAGVAMVNLTAALQAAPADVGRHLSTYGSAAIKTTWAWQAVFAEVRNTDDIRGLLYQSHLDTDAAVVYNPATPLESQVIESTWWKQDPNVHGFLALTNTSLASITATVGVGDNAASATPSQSYAIGPHATTWIDLASYWAQLPATADAGLIRITYSGATHAISPTGGMEDADKGYSHMLHFQIPEAIVFSDALAKLPAHLPANLPRPALPLGPTTFDSTGLMVGRQQADMQFPAGTDFMPYLVLRNTTAKPLAVRLAANAMTSASRPMDVPLGALVLAPLEARRIDMPALLRATTLNGFRGSLNLRTSFTGLPTDLLQESGSIDSSLNYVFEVPPRLEKPLAPGMLNYWSANGDTDTMVTIYNYGDAPQDVLVTLEHREGKYAMPIHLAPHASMMFSIGQLIRSGVPDAAGAVIPANIVQGSLRFSGLSGSHKDRLTIGIAGGIFNARTGTCSYPCLPCVGGEYAEIDPDGFGLAVEHDTGLDNLVQFSDGSQEDYTSDTSFESSDTSVASQYMNQTTGQAVGDTNIDAYVDVMSPDGCTCTGIQGCGDVYLYSESEVEVTPRILMGLNGNGPVADVTGSTQNVTAGQQVQLEAEYSMADGFTENSVGWSTTGADTSVGGWTPGTAASGITTSGTQTTLYWTAAGSGGVVLDLNYFDPTTGGDEDADADVTFNVSGPTPPGVSVPTGTWQVITDANGHQHLIFGGTAGDIGIEWTGVPATGYGGAYKWGQVLTDYEVDVTAGGVAYRCTPPGSYPMLDNNYPYSNFVSPGVPDDNPGSDLTDDMSGFPGATAASVTIAAKMFLLWNSGITGAIDVPLASGTWAATGSAQYSFDWSLQPSNGGAAAFLTASPAYPAWNTTFKNGQLGGCVVYSARQPFFGGLPRFGGLRAVPNLAPDGSTVLARPGPTQRSLTPATLRPALADQAWRRR